MKKKYSNYRDSKYEWLREFPSHWSYGRLRYLCDITTGERDTINQTDNGKYPFFVRSQDVKKIDTFSFDGES